MQTEQQQRRGTKGRPFVPHRLPHPILHLLLVVIWVPLASAQSPPPPAVDWGRVHEITMHGIDKLYRMRTDEALQAFDSVARMAPTDPRGPFFKSVVHFSLYALDKDEQALDSFMQESDRTIGLCEELLDRDDHDATAKFYLGGTYGYRGMAYQQEGSILKAVADGRRGYALLEEAVEERPDLYDAQMGFGLYRYLTAKAPRSLQWMLRLLGIDANLEGGLHSLRLAADHGIYTRNEARLYLAQFLFNEHRTDEAFRSLDTLCLEYPENSLFLVLRSAWDLRIGKLNEALADARKAYDLNSRRPVRYAGTLALGALGTALFAHNDLPGARRYYEEYMRDLHAPERVTNWMWYRIGVTFELTGDRAKAVAAYGRMKSGGDGTRPWEAFYTRKMREYLSTPLNEAEGFLIRASNEYQAKKYASALMLFSSAENAAGTNPDQLGRGLLGVAQCNLELGDSTGAVDNATRLVTLTPERETWVIPHGYYVLGKALARQGKIAEAQEAWHKVSEYDDYDFQDGLEHDVERELLEKK
jgi:tetratricopeptide (TPR) repeat protein